MQGRQNAAVYIAMLERLSLFTEDARLREEDWIFQQDNIAIHTAPRSKDLSRLITFISN